MPKPHTFPTLFDEVKTVCISFLTKHGYLRQNQWQRGAINWSSNGNRTGSISIIVSTEPPSPYLELDYKYNEAPINYRVQLVSAPSNLGKGLVWYFVCPRTGKRCRKLYLADTYFYHRSAFRGCMYEKQTQSKKYRNCDKLLGDYFKRVEIIENLNVKYFKKAYAGKLTKKYLKLSERIKKADSIPYHVVESMLLS